MIPELVLIPCSGHKRHDAALIPAVHRYAGQHFKFTLDTALALVPPERVRIVSARFGLVALDALIPDYDVTMTPKIARDLHPHVIEQQLILGYAKGDDVLALLPREYDALLREKWPLMLNPLTRLKPGRSTSGIGAQRAVLAAIARDLFNSQYLHPTTEGHDDAEAK